MWRGRRPETASHSGGGPEGEGGGAEGSLEAPEEAGRGGCPGETMMTATRSNVGGGAYRWADEGGQRGGCPTSTSSERESEGGRTERGDKERGEGGKRGERNHIICFYYSSQVRTERFS